MPRSGFRRAGSRPAAGEARGRVGRSRGPARFLKIPYDSLFAGKNKKPKRFFAKKSFRLLIFRGEIRAGEARRAARISPAEIRSRKDFSPKIFSASYFSRRKSESYGIF